MNNEEVYTVSQLNLAAKRLLSGHFPSIWVIGEISNLAQPSSGHLYFSLKDRHAQIRCAMFRSRQKELNFMPENGVQVLVNGSVGLYEPRGDYQLIIDHMEEAGDGALRRAFEKLKRRLAEEGLFDLIHKQAIPKIPQRIGIITSPSGAAVRDILTVLKRRFASIPVVVYPASVQGAEAMNDIVKAIKIADRGKECDVLIIARGGGSLEDLWAFNEEQVARAINRCTIPIISGIGHEIDFTIADFVADARAATPSAAAEMATPDQQQWHNQIDQLQQRLIHLIHSLIQQHQQTKHWLQKRLDQQRPDKRLENQSQRLDDLEIRMIRTISAYIDNRNSRIQAINANLNQYHPGHAIAVLNSHFKHLHQRLTQSISNRLEKQNFRLSELGRTLDSISPLATLSRGYAIVAREQDKKVISSSRQVACGDRIETKLAEGQLTCTVEETNHE